MDQGSEGTLVLTGANVYLGGTVVDAGCLQVGDGVTPSASIEGPVSVSSADGLVFDVAAGVSETFAGPLGVYPLYGTWPISSAVGSMLKTGPGTLTLALGGASASSTFGAITVNGGTLEFGNSNYLPKSTSLVVDDGATVDMDGHSITATNGAFSTVTLNNGSIINSSATRATLTASDSFNLANGTIGARVDLAGGASVNKRTDGNVTINSADALPSGGVFNDDPLGTKGQLNGVATSSPILLYGEPPAGATTWDNSGLDWYNPSTNTTIAWPGNDSTATPNDVTQDYVAVFNTGGTYTVTIAANVQPCEIEVLAGNVTIQDDGNSGSGIVIPDQTAEAGSEHESLEVYVASGAAPRFHASSPARAA